MISSIQDNIYFMEPAKNTGQKWGKLTKMLTFIHNIYMLISDESNLAIKYISFYPDHKSSSK